jgi:dUTP pyrophosphatase
MSTFTNTQFEKPVYQLNLKICSQDPKLLEYYSNISTHYNGDSGVDLLTNYSIDVEPFKVGTLDYQIQCEMINIETNKFVSYYLVPRSSISNTVFQMANSVGIIDAGYRGNIKAKVRSFNPHNTETLLEGKYFQIVSPDLRPIRVNIVQELSQTLRGTNGFGSTPQFFKV